MISSITRRRRISVIAVVITISSFVRAACAASPSSVAIEPWASKALEVTDGLVAWFDAAVQNAARKQHNQPELRDGDALDVWHDGSGNRLDVRQSDPASRPKLRFDDALAFVRFDGGQANLSLDKLNRSFRDLTIFIVAAPYSNEGNFLALLALNAEGQDDYRSGLNIDQGPSSSTQFNVVNVEGVGFGGVRNLMTKPVEFRRLQRICLASVVGQDGTALYVNGEAAGSRDRDDSTIRMDQLVIGARCYSGPEIRSFFAGEIAEVLIYDRKLTDDERHQVDRYLAGKYAAAKPVPPQAAMPGTKPLERVENPPAVQMFVPGFVVKELPVDLPNINNVLYRDDGKLVALGYNGNVYLLSDTDGDGLEDKADVFFENKGQLRAPIGMALTPPGYSRGRGIFTPSKGKCSLIVDTDGDDVADEEIIVAEGWIEGPHGVDTVGIDFDPRDGSVYFGLGCENFANAYVAGPDGKARYRLDSERGTIMRVAPDFKSREVVATGIRFSVGIRFNRDGDLFCTDQEG